MDTAIREKWMREALLLAKKAEKTDEVPIGAILVHENQVIGYGKNLREESHRTLAHAEILALEDYNQKSGEWRLPLDTALFVTAEPCLMCTGAMLWSRVSKIYYGCADTKNAGLQRIKHLLDEGIYDHKFKEVMGGILGQECSELLSSYFKKKRI